MTDAQEPTGPRWMNAWSREEGEERARSLLKNTFGVESRGVWSAPGRVNVVGEYTDLSNGLCLSTVIPHRTFVAASRREDSVVRITVDPQRGGGTVPLVWEGDLDGLEDLSNEDAWMSYPAGVLWALQERGFAGCGLDLSVVSCVPLSSGVSSSTSLTAATALAANGLWGLSLPTGIGATELAEVCMDAENGLVGSITGGIAQHTILRCTPGEAVYLDFASTPPQADACPLTFAEYGLGLLLIDTGVRTPAQVAMVRQRWEEVNAATQALGLTSLRELQGGPDGFARINALKDATLRKRARHIFTENERVELVRDELSSSAPAHERFVAVGKAMYRSHASLEVDLEVSCDELNVAVDTAFKIGALGARMVGAGGGGSVVALVRRAQAAGAAERIDAEFQAHGLNRPSFTFF